MPGFNTVSLDSLGGALDDFAPPIDSDTDLPAAGGNLAMAAVAGMSHMVDRAWAQLTWQGTSNPTVTAHDAQWGSSNSVKPTCTRTGTGTATLQWNATQSDEITDPAKPGYSGPKPINIRFGKANSQGGATFYDVKVEPLTPNSVRVRIWSGASPPALVDPTGVVFDVFVG